MNGDEELRLDSEPDEERKSDFPLGDNTVKTKTSVRTPDGVGAPDNENLRGGADPALESSPENKDEADRDK
jgi:hypothetical protein